jgi:hypothetical protein
MVSEIRKTAGILVYLLATTILTCSLQACENARKPEVKEVEKSSTPPENTIELKWTTAQYGNPAELTVESPVQLEAEDSTVPDSLKKLLERKYSYQFRSDTLYIQINIAQYKNNKADLKGAAAGAIEEQLKRNTDLKVQEKPIQVSGLAAIREDGTFSKDNERITVSAIIVTRDKMLWQVIVAHNEGNEEASKIKERILNSMKVATL